MSPPIAAAAASEPLHDNPLTGVWTYFAALCGGSIPESKIRDALREPRSPIRGQLRIGSGTFSAVEQDGDLCGLDVEAPVGPTVRCEGALFRSSGRFRLEALSTAFPGLYGLSGRFTAESWVPPELIADHGRQGFGTSRIEHTFELLEIPGASGSGIHSVLAISTEPNEVFSDPCTSAGLGPYRLYLVREPST